MPRPKSTKPKKRFNCRLSSDVRAMLDYIASIHKSNKTNEVAYLIAQQFLGEVKSSRVDQGNNELQQLCGRALQLLDSHGTNNKEEEERDE